MYRSRRAPPVDQSNVHSDSDVEQSKDDSDSEDVEHSKDESDSEDVEQSKDESGEEEVVLLLDDSAGEEEQEDVVLEQPADVQIVGPGIRSSETGPCRLKRRPTSVWAFVTQSASTS